MCSSDAATGVGDWPAPLKVHLAGGDGTNLVVVEEWESQAAQAAFMARLGPALGSAGVPEPRRTTWLPLVGSHQA